MKLGIKVAIGVGVVAVVGAVLFGTPFTKGVIQNYWGVGTKSSAGLSPVGATTTARDNGRAVVPQHLRGARLETPRDHV